MLALSLGNVKYVDARPQLIPLPLVSIANGSVTCGAIQAQILTQTPLLVANSCTAKIRAVRVCNTVVVHHECRSNRQCPRPRNVSYDFSCLKKNLSCKFAISCCETKQSRQTPRNWMNYFLGSDLTRKCICEPKACHVYNGKKRECKMCQK